MAVADAGAAALRANRGAGRDGGLDRWPRDSHPRLAVLQVLDDGMASREAAPEIDEEEMLPGLGAQFDQAVSRTAKIDLCEADVGGC